MLTRRRLLSGIAGQLALERVHSCCASTAPIEVRSIEELAALDPAHGKASMPTGGRAGTFRWGWGDQSASVERDGLKGRFVSSSRVSPARGAWIRDSSWLTPEMFGAQPGQADHYHYLVALFAQLREGMAAILSGQYRTTREVVIADRTGFAVSGGGRITSVAGTPVENGRGVLYFSGCTDFTLSSITLDANRQRREPREVAAHIATFQSCHRFKVENVVALNAVCDGFMLFSAQPEDFKTHCSEFEFVDCVAQNSYRQGCSVIQGHRGKFSGGSYGMSNGTLPSAGIDLESDAGDPFGAISDILIENVKFHRNAGFGLQVSTVSRPTRIITRDCIFSENGKGAISWGATEGEIARPKISVFGEHAERGAIDIPAGDGWRSGKGTHILSAQFSRIHSTEAKNTLIYVHSAAFGPVWIESLTVDRCGSIAGLHRDDSSLRGSRVGSLIGMIDGAISVSGDRCVIENNSVGDFFGSILIVTGGNAIIRDNKFRGPRFNDANGAIRVLGHGSTIEGNVIEAVGGTTGVRVAAPARSIAANRIIGFARSLEVSSD